MSTKRLVIKLSSGLLVRQGQIQQAWLKKLGRLVADLQAKDYQVWLVTSGAVALTKHSGLLAGSQDDIVAGQRQLLGLYKAAFGQAGLQVTEVIIAKEDFEHRQSYLQIRDQFNELARARTIALINDRHHRDNQALYQFNDNDEIAGLVASLVDAQRVILASTVSGILRPDGTVVAEVAFGDQSWTSYVTDKTSEHGRGGMLFKCRAAEHSAQRGVETVICDGSMINNLRQAATGQQRVGTVFVADKPVAARKRWILDKKDFASGVIQVDDGLARLIRRGEAVSLLTVGITSIEGNFLEHDIVAIKHHDSLLGYGETTLDAAAAWNAIQHKASALLVHYDKYARIKG